MALTIQITNFSDTELDPWFQHAGLTFNETLENTPNLIATATPTITHEDITVDVIVKNNK